MNTVEIIRKKRDRKQLTKEEIEYLVINFTRGKIPDYQFSAFLMAAYLNGMNKKETSFLTQSMLNSGKIIDLASIKGKKIDKHSTGGVGDKTSLIIAPIVAASGVNVPMISGRGLGHTGGTLDKLESIPGFKTNISLSRYINIIKKSGAVMIGQTKELAPADKIIYELRDVTATVESIPLITASIMSKKLAEGIDGLVLDVKTGSGAFMKKMNDAFLLANSLLEVAKSFKKKVIAFITDMNQPLGHYIGNWLEVYESLQILQGEKINDLLVLSLNLAGAMIYLGEKASSINEGREIALGMIHNGKAFNKFLEITKLQGGNTYYLKNPKKYPKSKCIEKIYSEASGYIENINTYQLGIVSAELGAGRFTKEDKIDPKAGIIFYPKIGDKIKKGDLIAEIYTDKKEIIENAKSKILSSIKYSKNSIQRVKLIKRILS